MAIDILESFNSTLGGPVERRVSKVVHEPEERTRHALRVIGVTILARLMHQAASAPGAAELFRAANDERVNGNLPGKIGDLIGNRICTNQLLELGDSLATIVFGHRTGAVTTAISQMTGVRPHSALQLLTLSLSLVFGLLRRQITTKALNPATLAALLFSQSDSLRRLGLDSRLVDALGFGSLAGLWSSLPSAVGPHVQHAALAHEGNTRGRARLSWAFAPVIAAAALVLIFGQREERHAQPAAVNPAVARKLESNGRTRLASAAHVYFESGDAFLGNRDHETIAAIAQSAKQQGRPVAVTGHAERTGDHAQRLAVAEHRAHAVKDALVAEGLIESQIILDPPTLSAEEARRVDIEVR